MAAKESMGKFISMIKVGEKGQIVIPKAARAMFDISPGDMLVILADTERGIALLSPDQPVFSAMMDIMNGTEQTDFPTVSDIVKGGGPNGNAVD